MATQKQTFDFANMTEEQLEATYRAAVDDTLTKVACVMRDFYYTVAHYRRLLPVGSTVYTQHITVSNTRSKRFTLYAIVDGTIWNISKPVATITGFTYQESGTHANAISTHNSPDSIVEALAYQLHGDSHALVHQGWT